MSFFILHPFVILNRVTILVSKKGRDASFPQHDKRGSFPFLLFVILNDSEGSLVPLFANSVEMLRPSA